MSDVLSLSHAGGIRIPRDLRKALYREIRKLLGEVFRDLGAFLLWLLVNRSVVASNCFSLRCLSFQELNQSFYGAVQGDL